MKFVLGVDEAGRGPLAGPVAVGVVAVPYGFDVAKEFPGVGDSKTLSEKKREEIFALLKAHQEVRSTIIFGSHTSIDERGIAPTVRECVRDAVVALAPDPKGVEVFLDGSLKAPEAYTQQTIIDGDALIPIISLASIAAKVVRDRHMKTLAVSYPLYGFESHKGYGTDMHYQKLREHGLCAIHRRTYIHIDFTPNQS